MTNATMHPTYEWILQQLRNAFPGECRYKYLICDNDKKFSNRFKEDLSDLFGLKLMKTSFRSPWMNGICERLIGTIRRDCLDHVIVINEEHLRTILVEYSDYYNRERKSESR